MKISKLFHWLYAIAMLLPVFAVGFACLTAVFNEQAYTTKDYEIQYKYESNDVVDETDILLNHIYQIDNLLETDFDIGESWVTFIKITSISYNYDGPYIDDLYQDNDASDNVTFSFYNNGSNIYINSATWTAADYGLTLADMYTEIDVSGIVLFTTQEQVNAFTDIYIGDYNKISQTDYNEILSVNEISQSTYDVFYYALDEMTQSPLFSWAYDSFLTAPIEYIVVLFSMPVDSPVVLMLSYWLTISIVWLCFDLIMYVPLLVHRWIDKGVLE